MRGGPSDKIIFASVFGAIVLFVWMVTTVSATSAPPEVAAQFGQPAQQVVESFQTDAIPGQAAEPPAPVYEAFVPAPAIEPAPSSGLNAVVDPVYVRSPYVNDLNQFIGTIAPTGGGSRELRGLFVQGILALSITQQPPGDNNWVTEEENQATIFAAAAQHGVIGLLAHNTRAGRDFSSIQPGQRIQLVYGDGSVRNYRLTSANSYQAIDPRSPSSDFVDLATAEYLSAGDVFNRYYTGSHPLILQTCIEQNGDSFWGRLFLVAEPE